MTRPRKSFLQRQSTHFVLLLTVFALGAVTSMHMFERMLLNQVQAVTEAANVAFTRLFVNEAWNELRPMMDFETQIQPSENPSLRDVDLRVRRFTKGTDLIKVKIYNLQGMTVYSSDPAQIGEDKAGNKGFQAAAQGRVASETTYRGKFGAFDGELFQRNLVSSYVPVKGEQGVEAVVEVYADRTTSMEGVEAEVRAAWAYIGPGTGIAFICVWLLSLSGLRGRDKQSETTTGGDAQASSGTNDPDAPAALLYEVTQVLSTDRDYLRRALRGHRDSSPDNATWQTMSTSLQALLTRIDELVLVQAPEEAISLLAGNSQQPLGVQMESVLAAFRDRHAGQGIALSGHVAPALANQSPASAPALVRLVDLLLDEASRRTGRGLIRLNFQPGKAGAMQIEVVGTRADGEPTPAAANAVHSLTLSAARAIASALKGHIEQPSSTSRGPWLSASVPLSL